jgi:hypothetical protein
LIQKRNGLRVVLTLDRIMRSVSVEVDLHELERAPGSMALAS